MSRFGNGRWTRAVTALGLAALIACQKPAESDTTEVLEEVRSLILDRRHGEAIAKMRELVDANPDDGKLQYLYGEALMASGQPSLAVWPLTRAMRDADRLVEAGLLLARAQSQSGSGVDAIKTTTRVLEADPENEEALLLQIEAKLADNLAENVLEDIDRVEALGMAPDTIAALRLDALLGLGREKEAEALLAELTKEAEAMREENPANAARLCAATATFTFERGDGEGARKRFAECLEGDGVRSDILVQAAVDFYDKSGSPELATDARKRRFELDPSQIRDRVDYAVRLQKVDRFEEAEKLLLEATETHPTAWWALTDLYVDERDYRKALESLDHAIAESPDQREEWLFTRADFQLALGDLDAAEKTLSRLEVPAHRELVQARLAMQRGELVAAAEHFEAGIRLWPDNPDARFLAGQVYERLGEWNRAAAHYREAARMDDPHYESSLALAGLQRALGDSEGVGSLLMRLADTRPGDAELIEKLIQFAGDTGAEELGLNMLTHLSRLRGKSGRAVAIAAERSQRANGTEAALKVIDQTGIDLIDEANVEALEARTSLLLALDRFDEAATGIEKALAKNPESTRLLVARAAVRRAQGRPDAAVSDLAAARAIDSRFLPAILALAEVEESAGRVDRARALYEEVLPLESERKTRDAAPLEHRGALALARLDLAAGAVDAARERLREVLRTDPRQGHAAWMLLQSYGDDPGGGGLDALERQDLALRAAVFEGSPAARDYYKKVKPSPS